MDETVIFLAPLMKHVQHRSGTRSPTRDVDMLIQGIMSTSPYQSPILGARLKGPPLWVLGSPSKSPVTSHAMVDPTLNGRHGSVSSRYFDDMSSSAQRLGDCPRDKL